MTVRLVGVSQVSRGSRVIQVPIRTGIIDLSNCCDPCAEHHLNAGMMAVPRRAQRRTHPGASYAVCGTIGRRPGCRSCWQRLFRWWGGLGPWCGFTLAGKPRIPGGLGEVVMSDQVLATAGRWSVASDDVQWILRSGQHAVSFVHSTREVLARCMREKGVSGAEVGEWFECWNEALLRVGWEGFALVPQQHGAVSAAAGTL
jgi:hypothetical protein